MARNKGTRVGNGAGGLGWGGPAKGAGKPAKPFTADSPTRVTVTKTVAQAKAERAPGEPSRYATRQQELAARADRYLDWMDDIASNPAHPVQVRLYAMEKARHEIVGTPIARNVNLSVDDPSRLSNAELDAELARLGGTAPPAASGEAPTDDPKRPDGVVH